MPPDLALLSILIGSKYPCLELVFMIPKGFEPLKFDCIYKKALKSEKDRIKCTIYTNQTIKTKEMEKDIKRTLKCFFTKKDFILLVVAVKN